LSQKEIKQLFGLCILTYSTSTTRIVTSYNIKVTQVILRKIQQNKNGNGNVMKVYREHRVKAPCVINHDSTMNGRDVKWAQLENDECLLVSLLAFL
jgi:hypothetical protein